MSCIVIGAGWSGLMCAYTLCKAGQQVTLVEAAPQTGGRARAIEFDKLTVDNGQHILLGAYHSLRQVLAELQVPESQLFKILPMELFAHAAQKIHMRLPKLPAPLHLIFGLLTAQNIPWNAKIAAIKFCIKLRLCNFQLQQDCSVLDLLTNYHQSEFLIKHLWEPIAVATMTTPINIASAQIFLNVLRLSFTNSASDSNWYFPSTDLSTLFPEQIEQYLIQHGAEIICGEAIKEISIDQDSCISVKSKFNSWQSDLVVLAIPPWQVCNLIKPHARLQHSYAALSQFSYEPITTVYFEFSQAVELEYPMLGSIGTATQWIFDRSFCAQPNVISVVISASGPHQNLTNEALCSAIFLEIKAILPALPSLVNQRVIREKRAAFCCDVAIQHLRPTEQTAIANLWLCGDYLQTGLPATLEGALISGKRTAELILKSGN